MIVTEDDCLVTIRNNGPAGIVIKAPDDVEHGVLPGRAWVRPKNFAAAQYNYYSICLADVVDELPEGTEPCPS